MSMPAHMLKLVAVVMCFGPAAPVLYFIGGISLLLSVTIQKFMLLKVYARPRPLDDALAWRSRGFLQALFFLHVTMAPLFYAERFHAILAATAAAKDSSKVAALQWYPGTTLAALDVAAASLASRSDEHDVAAPSSDSKAAFAAFAASSSPSRSA